MKYICKDCKEETYAKDFAEIVRNKKLCDSCISKNNIASRRRETFKKSKKKDIKDRNFQCNKCNFIHPYNWKPFNCPECNGRSFSVMKDV